MDVIGIEPAPHHELIASVAGLETFAVLERCGIARLRQLQEVAGRPVSAASPGCHGASRKRSGIRGAGGRDTGTRIFDHRCFGVTPPGGGQHRGRVALSDDIGERKEQEMRSKRQDKAGGTVDKVAGRVLDAFGKLTGNRRTQAKGKAARGRGFGRSTKARAKRR